MRSANKHKHAITAKWAAPLIATASLVAASPIAQTWHWQHHAAMATAAPAKAPPKWAATAMPHRWPTDSSTRSKEYRSHYTSENVSRMVGAVTQ
jgi:hypothetical protein